MSIGVGRSQAERELYLVQPNVLFFHVDNLGFGELSCYSGGPLRGVTTSRIDGFARDGFLRIGFRAATVRATRRHR
jgi:hypothetical protein